MKYDLLLVGAGLYSGVIANKAVKSGICIPVRSRT